MGTFRSDVVGSLLRPAYLVEARREAESGRFDPAAFKRVYVTSGRIGGEASKENTYVVFGDSADRAVRPGHPPAAGL